MRPSTVAIAGLLGLGVTCAVAAAALIMASPSRAAELERYPLARVTGWSVTLYWRDYDAAGRGHQRLSGYVATEGECRELSKAIAPKVKGGKLRCDFTDELLAVRP